MNWSGKTAIFVIHNLLFSGPSEWVKSPQILAKYASVHMGWPLHFQSKCFRHGAVLVVLWKKARSCFWAPMVSVGLSPPPHRCQPLLAPCWKNFRKSHKKHACNRKGTRSCESLTSHCLAMKCAFSFVDFLGDVRPSASSPPRDKLRFFVLQRN